MHYASGGEGSWKSIFTTLPRILIRIDGSVLPHITPQLLIVAALGVLATFWNPLRGTELDSEGGSQGGNVVVEVDNSLKLQPAMSVRRHCAITVLAPCYTQSPPARPLSLMPPPARLPTGRRDSAVVPHGV